MASERVKSIEINKWVDGEIYQQNDLLAAEEPLEIRIGFGEMGNRVQKALSVTMRTPGNDFELTTGFLFTEGIINTIDDIDSIHYCKAKSELEIENIVRVELKSTVKIDFRKLQRHFYTTSSCGVCGKSSIESISIQCNPNDEQLKVNSEIINSLPDKLHKQQPVFTYTGGLHASGLFTINGVELLVREDVGRHNALDKVIGAQLIKKVNDGKILVVSGRTSFELVQKAAKAGLPIVVAVGAPSSLAVDLAKNMGITLIGFTRKDRFNIYSGIERIEQ